MTPPHHKEKVTAKKAMHPLLGGISRRRGGNKVLMGCARSRQVRWAGGLLGLYPISLSRGNRTSYNLVRLKGGKGCAA